MIIPGLVTIGAGSAYGALAGGDQGKKGAGGLQSPGAFTPYVTSSGLQPGVAPDESGTWWNQAGMQGIPNYMAPGYREQAWWGNRGDWDKLADPVESYWGSANAPLQGRQEGAQAAYDAAERVPGSIEGQQRTGEFYNSFLLNKPAIERDAGLGAAYEAAKARMRADVESSTAARGTWGASTTDDQIRTGLVDLEADRASREADYRLQSLAEKRAWETLGSQAAGSADQASVDRYLASTQGARTTGELGLEADAAERDRVMSGLEGYTSVADTKGGALVAGETAAGLAQDEAYDRVQTYLNAQTGLAAQLDSIYGEGFSDMIENNQDLMNAQLAIQLAQDANWVAQVSGAGGKMLSEAQAAIKTYQMLQGSGGASGASSGGAAGSVPGAGTSVQDGMIVPY